MDGVSLLTDTIYGSTLCIPEHFLHVDLEGDFSGEFRDVVEQRRGSQDGKAGCLHHPTASSNLAPVSTL